jgi:5-methylcytosine-specific restriction enzyme subunit McrC
MLDPSFSRVPFVNEQASSAPYITAMDCSPFPPMAREQEEWLRQITALAKPADLLLALSSRSEDVSRDHDPIAAYDSASRVWWADRYVGELNFENRTLRIEPRFGMPSLMRWLSTIWGVRLLETEGSYEHRRVWLWAIIAHLWASRLITAAKHGLPARRVDEIYRGTALRGRLLARPSALGRATGDDRLVSMTRIRAVDAAIGGILLAAFARLKRVLGEYDESVNWLPDRGRILMHDLQYALGERVQWKPATSHRTIRYSPITEGYRPVVELSLSILNQRPLTTGATGGRKVFGILLDMAEIWELYIAKLLQLGLSGFRVVHCGRTREHFRWLFHSAVDEDTLGSLRPDIVIADNQGRLVGLADAKYKTTTPSARNRAGVAREDLYQIASYLSGFGDPESRLDGFLIYPSDEHGEVTNRLTFKNPWTLSSAPRRNLWFLSTTPTAAAQCEALSDTEKRMARVIHAVIGGLPEFSSAGLR